MSDKASTRKGRQGLGRGLDALLPDTERSGVREVHVDRIDPNPNQPRQHFERKALEDLASSLRRHGIMQPLVVSSAGDDRFRIIVGERRWQAAQLAGIERVPVVVKEATNRETLELALVENVQRADLNPLEEAAAFQRLTQEFGLSQQEIAHLVGRSRVSVTNTLRLLALPQIVKQAVIDSRISEGHARALLGLPDERLQVRALEDVLRDDLSVRQTEDLVRRLLEPGRARSGASHKDPNIEALETEFRRALGARVSLRPGSRGGRIVIQYSSDDEFQNLYDRLVGRT
ncbi:MAG TPA: ParB/RepB/Spo0J family partition protein [Chloroflexota bacterium]